MCKNKLYIISSPYCLLLILLKNKIKLQDIILFSKNDLSKKIFKNIFKYFIVIKIYEPKYNFFKLINYFIYLKLKLKKYLKNYEIIMSYDVGLIGQFFLRNSKKYILYEEGNTTYTNDGIRNLKIKRILGFNKENFGRSKLCKKIYLTGLAPIPEEIKDKVEIINLKELWNKKTEEEKKEILDIFGFDKDIINRIKNKKNILFTQPLSEDKFISGKEKIELYKKIISNYPEKDLVIKTHPRERTDYKKYFPEIEILNQSFPAELFDLLDIKFERAITIFSTAALNFSKNSKIDFYGTKVHPNLLKQWGDSEKIMKANKFIKKDS